MSELTDEQLAEGLRLATKHLEWHGSADCESCLVGRLALDREERLQAAEAERDEARKTADRSEKMRAALEESWVENGLKARREAFEEAASAIEGQYELIQGEGHGPYDFVVNGSATLRACAETIRALAEVER
jgi:hypothetical protein